MNTKVKTKPEIQKQCADFLDRNNFKMAVVPTYSEYGDMEVEGYEVYFLPKESTYWMSSDIRKHGIRVHRE